MLVYTVGLSSCGGDDSYEPTPDQSLNTKSDIYGYWTACRESGHVNDVSYNSGGYDTYILFDDESQTFCFMPDGTVQMEIRRRDPIYVNYDLEVMQYEGKYVYDCATQKLTCIFDNQDEMFNYSYSNLTCVISGNLMCIGMDGGVLFGFQKIGDVEWEEPSSPETPDISNEDNEMGPNEYDDNKTKTILCANEGLWVHRFSVAEEGRSYTTYHTQFQFAEDGKVYFLDYIKDYSKSWYDGKWRERWRSVEANGTYRVNGNKLECSFTYVYLDNPGFMGDYWIADEVNNKTFVIDIEDLYDSEESELSLRNGVETYISLEQSRNSDGSGDSDSSFEKPEVSYYDCDFGSNYIEVRYMILNKDKCGSLSNAQIYYGTSSASNSTNASISGVYITKRITGLKSNTKYKIKCSVTGSAGTTTTSEVTLGTSY